MMEEEASALHTRIYQTRVRECTAVKEAQALREDIYSYAPRSNAAKDYRAVIDELIGGAQHG
jgi:chromosome partitioning protein